MTNIVRYFNSVLLPGKALMAVHFLESQTV
jgi:hypothetical protein